MYVCVIIIQSASRLVCTHMRGNAEAPQSSMYALDLASLVCILLLKCYYMVATTSCKPLYYNNKFAVMPRHGRIIIYRIYVPLCVFSIHISARVNRYVRCSLESLLTLYHMFLPRNGYHSQEHVNSFSDHM